VIYESPYRTADTLKLIETAIGSATPVVVARELSKIHEEFIRGPAKSVLNRLEGRTLQGEVVILFHAREEE
jgi:16S rRNA (cytidine1402-2'-O)-methyltransferase